MRNKIKNKPYMNFNSNNVMKGCVWNLVQDSVLDEKVVSNINYIKKYQNFVEIKYMKHLLR